MQYQNLTELHRQQCEKLQSASALRYKSNEQYVDFTWSDYREQALACASALIDVGIQPGDRVALFSENRYEWLVADMGILTAGAVNVTPHAPLTARQVHYELTDSEANWLLISNVAQREKIEQIRQELPDLRGVVCFDVEAANADVISWQNFLQNGRNVLEQHRDELARREQQLTHDSLATLMYTSGTTGHPKGVMLTHGNLLSNAIAVLEIAPAESHDVILSWLPYSHIYARTVDHYRSIAAGVALCLAESVDTLIQNIHEIQPTQITAVPRFYEKVLAAVQTDDPETTANNLRGIFGSRIDYLSSGGAPLPPAIAHVYHDAGLLLLQGYGLTESSPVISFNQKESFKIETVGQAIPGIDVKIADDGEILTRGPHVMKGYWKKPEETAATIKDGWLYTGDLGHLDEEGFLSITGRKKELMVLSNGKKVVPAQLETTIIADPHIDQVVVFGEGRNFLTALIVPNWSEVQKSLPDVADQSPEKLLTYPATTELLTHCLKERLKDFSQGEQIKKFHVLVNPFTIEAEELTVSMKIRRTVIYDHYRAEVDALYVDDR